MVFIHELGHFLAAKAVGIEVQTFSIGWGPKLWGFKRNKTEYRLSWIPIGGYCKMKGEEDFATAINEKKDHVENSPGSFNAASPLKRIFVAIAGPLVNLLFAVIVLSTIWLFGYQYQSYDAKIVVMADYLDETAPEQGYRGKNSPAVLAGLKTGDLILSVNENPIASFSDLQREIVQQARQMLSLNVERDGVRFETTIVPELNAENGAGLIGISQFVPTVIDAPEQTAIAAGLLSGDQIVRVNGTEVKHFQEFLRSINRDPKVQNLIGVRRNGGFEQLNWSAAADEKGGLKLDFGIQSKTFSTPSYNLFEAFGRGWNEVSSTLVSTFRALGHLFTGLKPEGALSGPARIIYITGEVATSGFSVGLAEGFRRFFEFLSFISVALFFGNLLPIPALDGGQIVLFLFEGIRRKPVRAITIQRYQIIGLVIIIALSVFAIFGDIKYFIGK